jgi:hypothetical protein
MEPGPDHHLKRLRQWRNRADPDLSLSFLEKQFQREVARPHRQLARLVPLWEQKVPAHLLPETRLESFSHGVLRVAVRTSAALYELDRLLRGGLERELVHEARGSGLRRVRGRHGTFPAGGESGAQRG